jgi:hypothetical protein
MQPAIKRLSQWGLQQAVATAAAAAQQQQQLGGGFRCAPIAPATA